MIYYYLVAVLCVLCSLPQDGFCQDTLHYRHRLKIHLGSSQLISLDEVVSPLRYQGTSAMGHVGYTFAGHKNQHAVSLAGSTHSLSTNVDIADSRHGPTSTLFFQLTYRYQRRAYAGSSLQIWAGGEVGTTVLYKRPQLINTLVTGDAITSLSPAVAVNFIPSTRSQLRWQLSYPLVSNVVGRSYGFAFGDIPLSYFPSFEDVIQQHTWYAPHQLIDLRSTLSYEYVLTPRWSFCSVYQFRYWQYRRPLLIQSAMHIWRLGISFGL